MTDFPSHSDAPDLFDERPRVRSFVLALLLGCVSIVTQTILLRELTSVFYGNELGYAVVLGLWLVWVGLGSLLVAWVQGGRVGIPGSVSALTAAWGLALPIAVTGVSFVKPVCDVPPGAALDLARFVLAACILIGPPAFLAGGLFSALVARSGGGLERVYIVEAIGAAVGGLLFSFLLVGAVSSLAAAWIMGATLLGFAAWLAPSRTNRAVLAALACGVGLSAVVLVTGGAERRMIQREMPFGRVATVANSAYGRLVTVEQDGQESLYENGILAATRPDRLSVEEAIHYAMLVHPSPKRVLLVGQGFAGEIEEILKHGPERVDYVTLDPLILRVWGRPSDDLDPRVRIHATDGRLFVKRSADVYDVIILNVGDPHTAGTNRYYTREFFHESERILAPGGRVAFSAASSVNYLSPVNQAVLRSLYTTAASVLPSIQSIPGDRHLFLAARKGEGEPIEAAVLSQRLKERALATQFVTVYTLPDRLEPGRVSAAEREVHVQGLVNEDGRPIAYFLNMTLWSSHADRALAAVLASAVRIPGRWVALVGVLAAAVFFIRARRWGRARLLSAAVAAGGFSEIVFEIVVILAFQSLYGVVYQRISLIVASFMAGLVIGAVLCRTMLRSDDFKAKEQSLLRVQLGMALYPLALPVIFAVFRDRLSGSAMDPACSLIFACLPIMAGFLGGYQFILVSERCRDVKVPGQAGALYAADLFGAALGAVVISCFVIPLYGVVPACLMCAEINGAFFFALKKW